MAALCTCGRMMACRSDTASALVGAGVVACGGWPLAGLSCACLA